MALKIFCGPFQPELENAFIERLKSAPPGLDRRLAVVTPSRKLSDRLQRLICLENGMSLLNIRFHTFFSLALEIVGESGLMKKALIGDGLFHDMIVDRLLRAGGGRLSRGLAAAYRASLRDLIDAGVEPGQFREHCGGLLKEDQESRLEALFGLQEKYLERLENLAVLSPSGLTRLAAEALEEGKSGILERYAEISYYGFYDLTGLQSDFFTAVTGRYPAAVFLPYRKGHPAFEFSRRFFDLKLGQGGEPMTHLGDSAQGPLGKSLDCLFKPGLQAAVSRPGALKVLNVSGARDEAWAAAKEILRLHEEEGIPFNDIGIVARTLEPMHAVLSQILNENAVPFSMAVDKPLLRHPIAKLCLGLLTLRRRDFLADSFLDIVESPYFSAERFSGRPRLRWKRLIERLGVHSGWLQWVGKVSPCAEKDFELYPHAVKDGRKGEIIPKEDSAQLWKFVAGLHEKLEPRKKRPWLEHCALALALLEENFAVDSIPSGEDAAAWEKILELLEDLKVFQLVFPEASWEDFLEVCEEKIRRASLDGPAQNRGVRVMAAMDARGESFRALVLIGLTEGFFPRQVREDPLLTDSMRALLRHPAGYWISPKLEGYEEEKLLFYLLVSSAREKLVCVYQRSDDEGRAQIPSIYLRELCRACGADFDGQFNVRVPRQAFAKMESLPEGRLSIKEASLLMARQAMKSEPLFKPLGMDFQLFDGCLERVGELKRLGGPGEMDGIIGKPVEFLETLSRRGLSPTALDSFSSCPFKFFASRVLGFTEGDEPSRRGEVAPWLKGKIYHEILEKFYIGLKESGYWRKPDESWRRELERLIGKTFAQYGWKELGVYPLLWDSLKGRMSFHLGSFLDRDIGEIKASGLIPSLFEREAEILIDGRRYHGMPDRIDIDEKGGRFRVIDYKSSWGEWKGALEKKVLAMEAHQPPLYLEMIGQERSPAQPVGAFYYILEEGAEKGAKTVQEFSGRAWSQARSQILQGIETFAAQIELGRFPISPNEGMGGHCQYCEFHWLCRKGHAASRRRAGQGR